MFVINPDKYSLPTYRIGPFRTQDVGFNHQLPVRSDIDQYLEKRFANQQVAYTVNGRSAIHEALAYYNLQPDDVVTILTTTENFYISSCVTSEIEKFCRWSRKLETGTKVIFVNHEFGYPYKNLAALRSHGLPIIEDCCTTFFTEDKQTPMGAVGDFIVYSFPKFFPIQVGGLLVSNLKTPLHTPVVPTAELQYYKNVLSHYITNTDEILKARRQCYELLRSSLQELHLFERFPLTEGVVPSVFMFKKGDVKIDLPELKTYLWAHGIQCSVFYGEESFFIPAHQALTERDILYFKEVIKSFIDCSNKLQ